MNIVDRLYESGGSEVEYSTMEIIVGAQRYYLVDAFEPVVVRLETMETVTFQACGMDVAKPKKNADGVQNLRFALNNLTGEVSGAIRKALTDGTEMVAVLRLYLSTDLLAPAKPPLKMTIKTGDWTATEAQIDAGFMNLLDTAWPREQFNLHRHPGLRYFS